MPNITPFDKAILAAVLAPLTVLATSYLNGASLTSTDLIAAVVAAVIAGLGVYLKGNKQPSS
jgi:hypothetical protein